MTHDHPRNILVLVDGRGEGHADDGHLVDWHVTIHESDGDNLLVSAPDAQRFRQHIGTETPLPAQIAWVQLDGHPGLLPGSQGHDDRSQPVRGRCLHSDPHASIVPHAVDWFSSGQVRTDMPQSARPPRTPWRNEVVGGAQERASSPKLATEFGSGFSGLDSDATLWRGSSVGHPATTENDRCALSELDKSPGATVASVTNAREHPHDAEIRADQLRYRRVTLMTRWDPIAMMSAMTQPTRVQPSSRLTQKTLQWFAFPRAAATNHGIM